MSVVCAPSTHGGWGPFAKWVRSGLQVLLALICGGQAAWSADAISIDFSGGGNNGTPTAMAAGESAGVLTRTNWTSFAAASGSASALVDDSGAATTAAVTWASNGNWSTTITEAAGNARMMKGYLDTTNTSTTTVTVSSLPTWLTRYDIYVYVDSDLGGSSSVGRYTISTAANPVLDNNTSGEQGSGNFSGTFLPGNGTRGNYVLFRGVTGSGFTLSATPAGGSVPRAPVNGLQIVQQVHVHRPIALNGWTHDVVWENAGSPSASNSDEANPNNNASAWFEEGVGGHDDGFPATRRFTSVTDSATQYLMQPYSSANALRLNSGTAGVLTFQADAAYSSLRILASSGSGGGAGSLTITFTDTTTSAPIAFTATDWGGNNPTDGALPRLGRSSTSTSFTYNRAVDFNLYETRLDLTALGYATKAIHSVSFTKPVSALATNVFAISGQSAGISVAGVSPAVGVAAGNTGITITGVNFVAGATVDIGGVSAGSVTWVDANHLTAVTPAHASGPVAVTVTNPDGTGYVLEDAFTYLGPPPTISGFSPAFGPALTTTDVTIGGSGFVAPVSVTVGGVPATNVTYVGSGTITVRIPAMTGTDSTPLIVVSSGDGQTATSSAFTWALRPVDDASGAQAGLAYRYHHLPGPRLPDFSASLPFSTGVLPNVDFIDTNPIENRTDDWSAEFSGYLTVPVDGIYTLYTESDDGSRLSIGVTPVVENNFSQGLFERSGQIALTAGTHRLRVEYAQGGSHFGLRLRWQGPTVAKELIPDNVLSHDPPPTITAVNPTGGPQAGGTPLTITGNGFVAGSLVAIGGTVATDAVVLSSTSISLISPGGPVGAQNVHVIGPRSSAATLVGAYTYTTSPAPTISGISPASGTGLGGTTVTLTVGNVATVPTVTFNGTPATAVTLSGPNTVTCVTPAMPGSDATADVVMTSGGQGATLTNGFTYLLRTPENPSGTQAGIAWSYHQVVSNPNPLPDFSVLTPNSIGVRANVTINNANPFESGRAGNWSVDYRGYINVPSDGIYTFYTESDDGSRLYIGNTLVVENNFYQGNSERSGVIALAAGRHVVRITFAQGGGGYALFARYAGPGLGKTDIPDAGFTTDPAPVADSLDVVTGPTGGGTTVVITGSGFVAGAAVTFGGVAASSITVAPGGTQITCVTPSHVMAVVDVTVINPNGDSSTIAGAFEFIVGGALTLSGINPAVGSVVGGTSVDLIGTGFVAPVTVSFAGVAATGVVVNSDTSISVIVPRHAGGALNVDVMVTNGGGLSATLIGGFTYTLRQPENPSNTQAGLTYRYHRVVNTGTPLPDFSALTPDAIGSRAAPQFPGGNPFEPGRNDNWSVDYRGYVEVANDGVYTFYTDSDDGSRVYIGNTLIVDNNYFQGTGNERSGVIGLATGRHAVRIVFAQGNGGSALYMRYQGPSLAKTDIPASAFTTSMLPTVTGTSPGNGPVTGGTAVTVTGTGFTVGSTISFGGIPGTSVVVAGSGQSLTTVTPAHALGDVVVAVINGEGLTSTTTGSFLYEAPMPTITAVAPQVGPVSGGTDIIITGNNFQSGVAVTIGGAPVSNLILSGGTIYARTPAGTQGPTSVVVTNTDHRSVTRSSGFYFQGLAPTVGAIAPSSGIRTATYAGATITGTNFTAGARVFLGGIEATPVTRDSATQLSFTIPLLPSLQGPVDVVVTNTDLQTGTLIRGYRVIGPAPTITTLTPASGPQSGGTSVRIDGTGFYAGVLVSFDGVAIGSGNVTVVDPTRIDVVTPVMTTQGAVDVVVTNTDLGSATRPAGFIAQGPAPTVTSATPNVGPLAGGQNVTVNGTGFIAGARVFIGGVEAAVSVITATSISVVTPALSIQGPQAVVVTNVDQQSGTLAAGYIAQGTAPTVASLDDTVGPLAGGETLTITGSGFLAGARVFFGAAEVSPADVTVTDALHITVITPAGAQGPNDVTVTNVDLLSDTLTDAYLYLGAPPVITGVNPLAVSNTSSTPITISGSGFAAGIQVTIGGITATITTLTATAITVTMPGGLPPGPAAVVVTNIDLQTTTFTGFIAQGLPPTITALTLTHGPLTGGTTLIITGTNFYSGANVTFDGVAATGVTVVNATTIQVTTPANAQGPAAVVVTNVDLQSVTASNAFIFEGPAPTLSGITPASGALTGGTPVTISGADFAAGASVTFDGVPATAVVVQGAGTITAVAPAGIQGPVDVVVTNVDLLGATLTNGYVYLGAPPIIGSVTPMAAPNNIATTITITGSGFVAGVTVTIGGSPASLVSLTAGTLVVTTPLGMSPGPVSLVVTNIDGQSATLGNFIVQGPAPILTGIDVPFGPVVGGRRMTLTRSAFRAGAVVSVGGAPATVLLLTATTIVALTPGHDAGAVTVTVTNDDLQSSSLVGGYHYYTPSDHSTPGNGCGTGGGLAALLISISLMGFGRNIRRR